MKVGNIFGCAVILAAVLSGSVSCDRTKADLDGDGPSPEAAKADQFAIDVLGMYYLWNEEIEKDLSRLDPDTCRMPMDVVKSIRYREGGKEVDRWTVLTNDLMSFQNSVQGLGVTYGYDLVAGSIENSPGNLFLVVNYVSKGGPAEKAGLKRGDIILTLDGKDITMDNVYDALNTMSVRLGVTGLSGEYIDVENVREVSLRAVDMYEDPVLVTRTYDVQGKKVGYLVYNSFDLKSSMALPDVFKSFKSDGIDELVIDLRYNGGGYAFTENVLASMMAPSVNVLARNVFQTEVYNSVLADAWKKQGDDTNTYFSTVHELTSQKVKVDVSDANPEIDKVYVIVTGSTASASEGLIVGLRPYMDVVLVGQRTYGKYCAGIMLSPDQFYNSRYDYSLIKNWGMYVMVSKFADCNGDNASIPEGIPVDVDVKDNPLDGYQLGDENETMLRAALQAAGKVYPASAPRQPHSLNIPLSPLDHGAPRGLLIKTSIPPVN